MSNSDKSPSPLCTGADPQRPVRGAATAEGGSAVSIPDAWSPPLRAEVMKDARLTCALRCTAKGRGLITKAAKPTQGGDDVIDECVNAQAFLYALAKLLLHYFPRFKKENGSVDYSKMQNLRELGQDWD